jgi:hypothetical protein
MANAIRPIQSGISTLGSVWSKIWGGIADVAKRIAGAVAASIGGIVKVIQTVIGWVQTAIGWFVSLWNNADRSQSKSQQAINTAARAANVAGTHFSGSLIGNNLSAFARPSKDVGGWIYEVPRGQPLDMTGHGGEYVLSLDMLAGRQPIDPRVKAAVDANGPSMSERALTGTPTAPAASSAPQVTVVAQTNASPRRIASEVGWLLRAQA